MKRLFIAIKINPNDAYKNIHTSFKQNFKSDNITWVNLDVTHLTLKFLGETQENKIEEIDQILNKITLNFNSFELNVNNIGIFGSKYEPRVIWLGIEKSEHLENLVKAIFDQLETIGFTKDRQNFVPHLTLGRIKNIADKKAFQNQIDLFKNKEIQKIKVTEFHLYESILHKTGPQYFGLKSYILR
ncbi:MAG: RNA 2',3'-cyclic phosphodiesterase [Bacteroidetes bacterium]|nr:RNA 2',3'-cyclic phosphodiesterase [Bacteroidota bacterium]